MLLLNYILTCVVQLHSYTDPWRDLVFGDVNLAALDFEGDPVSEDTLPCNVLHVIFTCKSTGFHFYKFFHSITTKVQLNRPWAILETLCVVRFS